MMTYFVHNSHRLSYREQGEGPLLLILPGNTASSKCYEGELAYFSRWYHTVSFDYRGTGQSDRMENWPEDWWTLAVQDGMALLDHLGQETSLVMGSSGGGIVALLMAIRFPERVRAVVADSCVARWPAGWASHVVSVRERYTSEQIAFYEFANGSDWRSVVEADSQLLINLAQGGIDWFEDRLGQIRCPVMLTASLQDEALPDVREQVGFMATQIPGCRAFLANQGRHPLMWTCADDFRAVSESFLRGVSDTETPAR
jgi:pimeloyl-ACP methyl ester carboxylesterase